MGEEQLLRALCVCVLVTAASATSSTANSAVAATKLVATVGPGYTISLKTASGARATRLKAGNYALVVRDRSALHNFHLGGTPSTDRHTGVAYVGVKRWNVSLIKGTTYTYVCDAHADSMKGSVRVT